MKLEDFQIELKPLPGAMPVWHGRIDAQQWRAACQQVRGKGGRLVALWGADNNDRGQGYAVHAALTVQSGLLVITLPIHGEGFPDISDIFPAANRMQRAAFDLLGIPAEGAERPPQVAPPRRLARGRIPAPQGLRHGSPITHHPSRGSGRIPLRPRRR